MSENKEDRGPERTKATKARLVDDHEMAVRLVEAVLTEVANKYPSRRWLPLECEMVAEALAGDAAKLRMPLTGADVEIAVRALDLAGTIVIAERGVRPATSFQNGTAGAGLATQPFPGRPRTGPKKLKQNEGCEERKSHHGRAGRCGRGKRLRRPSNVRSRAPRTARPSRPQ